MKKMIKKRIHANSPMFFFESKQARVLLGMAINGVCFDEDRDIYAPEIIWLPFFKHTKSLWFKHTPQSRQIYKFLKPTPPETEWVNFNIVPLGIGEGQHKRALDNSVKNYPKIMEFGKSLNDFKENRPNAYILGNGHSLNEHAETLKKIDKKNSFIIGVNRSPSMIDPTLLDYYFLLDPSCDINWAKEADLSQTTALFHNYIPTEFLDLKMKEKYFFHTGKLDFLKRNLPQKFMVLQQQKTAVISAVILLSLIRTKNIIFLGCDSCLRDGEIYKGQKSKDEVIGVNGHTTTLDMLLNSLQLKYLCFMLAYPELCGVNFEGQNFYNGSGTDMLYLSMKDTPVSLDKKEPIKRMEFEKIVKVLNNEK